MKNFEANAEPLFEEFGEEVTSLIGLFDAIMLLTVDVGDELEEHQAVSLKRQADRVRKALDVFMSETGLED